MDRRALVAAEVRAVVVEVCQRGGGSTDPALHLLEHASRLMSLQVSQGSGVSTSVMCPGAGPGIRGEYFAVKWNNYRNKYRNLKFLKNI